MYGPLLDRRNLLLVDQRGTGRSEPIDCPALQDLKGDYAPAAAACGAALGARADDYSTALSADDLAAVVDALGLGPGRRLRRLLRHLLRPGLRRPPPRAGPQRGARQRLPDLRRGRRGTPPRDRRCARRSPSSASAPRPAATAAGRSCPPWRRCSPSCARSRGAARPTTRTAAGCGSPSTARGWPRSRSARRTRRRSTASSPRRCAPGCPATAGRCSGWSPRPPAAAPTPGRSRPTARGSTPRSPATTTRSSTT